MVPGDGPAQPERGDENKSSENVASSELKAKIASNDRDESAQILSDESIKFAAQSSNTNDSGETCREATEPLLFFCFLPPLLKGCLFFFHPLLLPFL